VPSRIWKRSPILSPGPISLLLFSFPHSHLPLFCRPATARSNFRSRKYDRKAAVFCVKVSLTVSSPKKKESFSRMRKTRHFRVNASHASSIAEFSLSQIRRERGRGISEKHQRRRGSLRGEKVAPPSYRKTIHRRAEKGKQGPSSYHFSCLSFSPASSFTPLASRKSCFCSPPLSLSPRPARPTSREKPHFHFVSH